ncbi:MAG: hypothetical protein ACTSP6_11295 [Promethearchaeota archaeon]
MDEDKTEIDDHIIVKLALSKKVIFFFKSRAIIKNLDYRDEILKFLEKTVDVLTKSDYDNAIFF